ncbi:MAG: uracil-DNA glycosylase [Chitinophagaceae bacterium]|nr:uracil-DNA glycosylase [Rubrivivax sp.]
MPWSERQVAMLKAMGLATWQPAASAMPRPAAVSGDAADAADKPQSPTRPSPPIPVPIPPATPPQDTVSVGPAAGATARPDLATLDWPALRQAVAECRACALCASRRQTVFGVGHPRAQWMVVGEAPGAQEDERGEPFVGAAGQLLDNMLRALNLSRAEDGDPTKRVYIANTLKCRPPGNRNPQADEMTRCEPFLWRQIALLQPRLILAMGRFAVQALLRSSEPVGRLRGRVHAYQGVPLVVTYHPAYLLRNLPDKARAWDDLCLAAAVAERAGDARESPVPGDADGERVREVDTDRAGR